VRHIRGELIINKRHMNQNTKSTLYVIGGLIVFIGLGYLLFNSSPDTDKSDLIRVTSPESGATVSSPLTVDGEARGTWYFEASFPVKLLDSDGNELAVTPAEAQGEWMTEDFVPFTATLEFDESYTGDATLVLQKDNPSGLPENDDELRIPLVIGEEAMGESPKGTPVQQQTSSPKPTVSAATSTMSVVAYFTNSKLAPQDTTCEKVFSVTRAIPKTSGVGKAALEELFKGPSASETAAGYETAINPGVVVQSLSISNGVAKVDLNSQLDSQVGGSCRVAAIRSQITETLKQFSTVNSVVISIDGRIEDILQP